MLEIIEAISASLAGLTSLAAQRLRVVLSVAGLMLGRWRGE
jgi:hypothetical protein